MANLGYLQLTRGCLHACRFCSNPPTGTELDADEMRREIDRLVELGYDGVILTGGEPASSPLLFEALGYAAAQGLHSRMISNGQRLAQPAFFQRCVDAGLRHLHLSIHSHRREVHDFITMYPGAWDALVACLELVEQMGISCDINTVINTYNADHLHQTVTWLCERFGFLRHFVWNNIDPNGNRTEQFPDCVARLHEMQGSLELAMEYLHQSGRSFRAERVPLCFMRRFAWASTETRKIIKEEERCIRFLDGKGFVRQQEFLHGKAETCQACNFDPICAGLFSMAKHYDERELAPVFDDPIAVVREVLGSEPSAELVERLLARRGRRSLSEHPSEEQRPRARLRVL